MQLISIVMYTVSKKEDCQTMTVNEWDNDEKCAYSISLRIFSLMKKTKYVFLSNEL